MIDEIEQRRLLNTPQVSVLGSIEASDLETTEDGGHSVTFTTDFQLTAELREAAKRVGESYAPTIQAVTFPHQDDSLHPCVHIRFHEEKQQAQCLLTANQWRHYLTLAINRMSGASKRRNAPNHPYRDRSEERRQVKDGEVTSSFPG